MFILKENILPLDTPFEHEGIQYPSNWLRLTSLEEKQAIGITEVPDPTESFDMRFYNSPGQQKDLDEVKTQWINYIKISTSNLVSNTDWYIIRKVERNVDIPQDIINFRAAAFAESKRIVSEIETANAVSTIIELIDSQRWPSRPS
jgi:hypothetical protein